MKLSNNLLALFIVSFGLSIKANAFEYSPFACNYIKFNGDWYGPSVAFTGYTTTLGWNQSGPIGIMTFSGTDRNATVAICPTVSSTTPDNISLNISNISGNNLELPSGIDCAFTGEVAIEFTTKEITKIDEYLYTRKFFTINNEKFESLDVVGVQSIADNNPSDLCEKAFAEATKNEVAPRKQGLLPSLKIKFKNTKGITTIL